jgi:DNA polymerase-1
MESMGNLLGYSLHLITEEADLADIVKNAPSRITYFGFDTETDTKIDMTNRDGSGIDIVHDMPFQIMFGYGSDVWICDKRTVGDAAFLKALETCRKLSESSVLALAHNIKFDLNMMMNAGCGLSETAPYCDTMAIARLALEAKSEREGGYSMQLKPLARRLLGSQYGDLGHQIDDALRVIWQRKLGDLMRQLKPYKLSRRAINDALKDVTGTLDEFSEKVQLIWRNWEYDSRVSYMDVDPDLMHMYGGCDVILVLELTKLLLPRVAERKQAPVLKREMALIRPLIAMERTGYTVDKTYLIKSKQALVHETNLVKDENARIIGRYIGANQNAEMKKAIADKFGYTLSSTDKQQMHVAMLTDPSMPEEVKTYISNVIYLRTLEKWIATYVNPILHKLNTYGDTKVYTQYNPNGAVSGRFTSNFQQFPKNAIVSKYGGVELFHPRKMFVVDKTYPELCYIDYSQVELRVQAAYTYYVSGGSEDVNMLRAYMPFKCHEVDGKWYHDEDNVPWEGVDLHTQSTHMAFPDVELGTPEFKKLRSLGKRVNFAMIYGASLKKVQETLSDIDPEIVAKLYRGFNDRFKTVKTYGRWVSAMWYKNGGYVTNLLGRRYYMTDSSEIYKLQNYLIQGSSADIIKAVIIRVDEFLRKNGLKTKLQGCIHDELCICVAEGEHAVIGKIKEIMETTVSLPVPLVAEVSISRTNWAEKKGD